MSAADSSSHHQRRRRVSDRSNFKHRRFFSSCQHESDSIRLHSSTADVLRKRNRDIQTFLIEREHDTVASIMTAVLTHHSFSSFEATNFVVDHQPAWKHPKQPAAVRRSFGWIVEVNDVGFEFRMWRNRPVWLNAIPQLSSTNWNVAYWRIKLNSMIPLRSDIERSTMIHSPYWTDRSPRPLTMPINVSPYRRVNSSARVWPDRIQAWEQIQTSRSLSIPIHCFDQLKSSGIPRWIVHTLSSRPSPAMDIRWPSENFDTSLNNSPRTGRHDDRDRIGQFDRFLLDTSSKRRARPRSITKNSSFENWLWTRKSCRYSTGRSFFNWIDWSKRHSSSCQVLIYLFNKARDWHTFSHSYEVIDRKD